MSLNPQIDDFELVWANDRCPQKDIYQALLENKLYEYPYSARTKFFLINDEFYFVKGYLAKKDFTKTISLIDCRNQNPVEHFIQFEASVYYVLGLRSTISYSTNMMALIDSFKKQYKASPCVPEPVAVYRYNSRYQKQYNFQFSSLVRCKGCGTFDYRKLFKAQVNKGISFLIYKYPYFPHRPSSLIIDKNGHAKYHIHKIPEPDLFIQNIIDLFSKIINLGYIFTDYIHSGNCLQIQNITTKGHFLDMDSIFYLKRQKLDLLEMNIYILLKELRIIGVSEHILDSLLDSLRDAVFVKNKSRKNILFSNIRNRLAS